MKAYLGTLAALGLIGLVRARCPKVEHNPVDLTEYYSSVNNLDVTGNAFKRALSKVIDGHHSYKYSPCTWDILQEADEHPTRSDSILALYTQKAIKKSFRVGTPGANRDAWDREHVWAKSHGFPGKSQDGYTDCHHLMATDTSCNSARSSHDFKDGGSLVSGCNSKSTRSTWEPPAIAKGPVARAMFYMATRYEGPGDTPDLELIDGPTTSSGPGASEGKFGYLSDLKKWHCESPVTPRECTRNTIVHSWQGNRNPFVDHPEFVEKIWGPCPAGSVHDNNPLPCGGDTDNTNDDGATDGGGDNEDTDIPVDIDDETPPPPPTGTGGATREALIASATSHLELLQRLPASRESCAAFGCRRYTRSAPCQCNSKCRR